jgi:O-antigen/teichoic acid export membrane protein
MSDVSPGASLRARLRSGVAWNLLAAASTQGATFAVNLIVSNLLGRSRFGEYGMVYGTLRTLGTVAQLAIGMTATRYLAEARSSDPERAGRVLGLCTRVACAMALLAGTMLLAAAPWLARDVLKASHLVFPLRLAAVVAAVVVFNGFQSGALAGLEAYRAMGRCGFISGVTGVAACAVGAAHIGLLGAVGGLLMSGTLHALLLHRALRVETARFGIVVRYRGLPPEAGLLLRFALPAALPTLSFLPAQWLASAMLVRGAGYMQMGLFSAAYTLRTLVVFVPYVVCNVGISMLSHEWGRGEGARYRKLFFANLGLTSGATVAGALAVAGLGPYLLRAFGQGYDEGQAVLRILVLAAVCEGVSFAMYQVFVTQEKMWFSFLCIWLPRDLLLVALARVLSPRLQAVGLASAYAGAHLLLLLLVVVFALRAGIGRAATKAHGPPSGR